MGADGLDVFRGGGMSDTDTCYCGHVEDEHEETKMGAGACTVEGRPCIQYDHNPDDEEDDDE